jgi:SAM-dependent methyltransferase
VSVFEEHADRYDQWFEENAILYRSELAAVRKATGAPPAGGWRALEVGAGTGRFSVPLGIPFGIEPASAMRNRARERGMNLIPAVAEEMPIADGCLELVLIVATICFVDDPAGCLSEARRTLQPNGRAVVGYIDRDSPLGSHYRSADGRSPFYEGASFYRGGEIERLLLEAGLRPTRWLQTLFGEPGGVWEEQEARPGRDEGSFVVVTAERAG